MDDLIAEFLTETNESLGDLDTDLVNLEQNPNDMDLLSKIFRLVHTIKGTCGFLGLPRLEGVAHKGEDVLGLFRDGTLQVTPEYVTLIFECLDCIKEIISGIEETGSEPAGDDSALISRLEAVYNSANGKEPSPQEALDALVRQARENVAKEAAENTSVSEDVTSEDEGEDDSEDEEADEGDSEGVSLDELEAAFLAAPGPEDMAPSAPQEPAPVAVEKPVVSKTKQPQEPAATKESGVAAQSLRVNVDVLENLMTMVSELVLTRNQLLQILRSQKESEFSAPLQRLNHVVSDLQEGVMKTRMQPIGNAWAKLPRIIRDISIDLNKKIDLDMRGKETELDRQVLELIKDPLTHMVRNSADHGIETPTERVAAGKPETGKLILNAYHEGGHIIIEISDDGKGLNTQKIREKVLANGLATEEELADMSIQQIQQFIFKPGFSTADKVTAVSGRGVGMDVVRTNIEKIGGSIELKSTEGKGSRFLIKIPLTLAIVSALIVESAGERFAIPQLAVRELVMASTEGENRIETIKGTPVFRLRDHLLPLVSLQELLKITPPEPAPVVEAVPTLTEQDMGEVETQAHVDMDSFLEDLEDDEESTSQNDYIVVAQVGAYMFGIIVDRVFDTEEIVVKPVAGILRDIDMFSGNTILGDGSVIMILDPAGIAKCTGEIDSSDTMDVKEEDLRKHESSREKTSLLLFAAGDETPKTVPLELVSRLEEVDMGAIETANGHMVVQYRGKLMPLVPFDSRVHVEGEKRKPVLVFSDDNHSMGLVVDRIIDILDEYIDVQMEGGQGIVGSAIINEKSTDVVDVGYYLRQVNPNWFKNHGDEPFEKGGTAGAPGKRVLLVEDSPFFRNMLSPILKVAGYRVTTAESAVKALKLCEDGKMFDLIISDIEMPEMSGFEFAEKVRATEKWQDTPMIALSSHTTPQDMDRGMQAGFSKYVAKFDRDTLLDTLSQTLSEYAA
ncbi:MAG: chemotaxis protein CheW [Alphaproteobacteria bacterium]|nr:chemotaxis protein CheW [Alphaproteobacteria bacterium]